MTRLRLCDLSPEQRAIAREQLGMSPLAPIIPPNAPPNAPAPAKPTHPIAFFAEGLPATKGSARAFVDERTGTARVKGDCARTKPWQRVVGAAALAAGVKVWSGAVQLELTFFLPRPLSHHRGGKRGGKVKPDAPRWPLTKPDGDKLERAILDALTGVAYTDDSRVRGVRWAKAWAPKTPGVHVLVVQLDEQGDDA